MIASHHFRTCIGAACATLLAASAVGAAEPVGFVAARRGETDLRTGELGSWRAALVDEDVVLEDHVRTGPVSAAKILLVDDTTLAIGESTLLRVESFVTGPAALQERSVLELLSGHMRAWIGEAFGGATRIETHTPTAVIGVKGTAYDVWVREVAGAVTTLVCVTEGEIWVENRDPAVAGRLELASGECARVDLAAQPVRLAGRPDGYEQVGLLESDAELGTLDMVVTPPAVGLQPPDDRPPDDDAPPLDPLSDEGNVEDPVQSVGVQGLPEAPGPAGVSSIDRLP